MPASAVASLTTDPRILTILDSITDGFVVLDRDFRFVHVNRQAEEFMKPSGYTRADLLGRTIWERFPQIAGTPAEGHYRRALAEQVTVRFESLSTVSGRSYEVSVYPHADGLTIFYQDVTRQRELEGELHDRGVLLEAVFAHAAVGIAVADLDGRITEVNACLASIVGESPEALRGLPLAERIHPDDLPAARTHLRELARGEGGARTFELRIRHRDGSWIWCENSASLLRDRDDMPVRLLGIIEDVSKRKSAELEQASLQAELRRNEAQLRAVVDSIPQLAWISDAAGQTYWYNQRFYEYTGASLDEARGAGWERAMHPSMLPTVQAAWAASVASGTPFEMEFPIRGADGRYAWFLSRANPVRDEHGEVVRWFGTNTNVDDVRRTREALREETRLLELLNDTGAAIAAELDLERLLQTVTDAATKLTGADFGAFFYNAVGAEGAEYQLFVLSGAPREAFSRFGHPRATPLFGPTFRGEGVIRVDDVLADPRYGQWAPHYGMPAKHLPVRSYLAVPVVSRTGDVIGGLFFGHKEVGMFTTRTERIVTGVAAQAAIAVDNARLYDKAQRENAHRARVEQELRLAQEELGHHADRLEADVTARTASLREALAQLEEFSYSVSHDLRAPIRAIAGYAQVLDEDHHDELGDEARWLLRRIARSADHMARLVDDVLTLSRAASATIALKPVALPPLLARIIERHPELQAPAATVDVEAPASVIADDALLGQALTNLLLNAVKFVASGVTPVVRVRSAPAAGTPGRVRITITDNGIGIRPEHRGKLFGMFQRLPTAERYEGTGIGLALVRKAVERMGGSVGVEPAAAGSVFWIELGGA